MNDIKETAKEIRTVLKAAFQTTKFSVKCHQFSQGEAVAISWTDGPAKNQVEPLVKGYGDGYSRYIRISRRESAVNAPGDVANWVESYTLSAPESARVVAETAPRPQEPAILVNDQFSELVALQELLISKIEEVNQLKLKIAELQVERDAAKYNQQQPQKAQPLSFDWWWEKGHQDYNSFKFSEPQHPKIKPYLDGWNSAEDSCRDSFGSHNIFTDK